MECVTGLPLSLVQPLKQSVGTLLSLSLSTVTPSLNMKISPRSLGTQSKFSPETPIAFKIISTVTLNSRFLSSFQSMFPVNSSVPIERFSSYFVELKCRFLRWFQPIFPSELLLPNKYRTPINYLQQLAWLKTFLGKVFFRKQPYVCR